MTDIKQHCCGADLFFDAKTAKKQYKKYLKNGPAKVTKKLIVQLKKTNPKGTLLDVGGGIGAIQWWFIDQGGKNTIGVDASTGYTALAKEHAIQNGFEERAHFIIGDFTEKAEVLPKVDHITLDKVICCYPDFEAILYLACTKTNNTVTFSYPMDGFIAVFFRGFMVLGMKLRGNPFKPFIHRVASVRTLMIKNGFELQYKELSFPWHIETYVKR
jgi:2-polyprenyl-3-methyl-5-hydroxy-6-metoxy-1,4-benzoquinol methylase